MPQLHPTRALLPLIILAAVACSGAKPKQVGEDNYFEESPPSGGSTESASGSEGSAPKEGERLNPDQKKQMEIALRRGGDKAANCSEVVPGSPTGQGEVKVTFDGQKGRATDVAVGPPFAGTPTEACIKRAFIGEIIIPFEGEPIEVPYSVKLPAKKPAPAAPKK